MEKKGINCFALQNLMVSLLLQLRTHYAQTSLTRVKDTTQPSWVSSTQAYPSANTNMYQFETAKFGYPFFDKHFVSFNFQKSEWKPLEDKFSDVLINSCCLQLSND